MESSHTLADVSAITPRGHRHGGAWRTTYSSDDPRGIEDTSRAPDNRSQDSESSGLAAFRQPAERLRSYMSMLRAIRCGQEPAQDRLLTSPLPWTSSRPQDVEKSSAASAGVDAAIERRPAGVVTRSNNVTSAHPNSEHTTLTRMAARLLARQQSFDGDADDGPYLENDVVAESRLLAERTAALQGRLNGRHTQSRRLLSPTPGEGEHQREPVDLRAAKYDKLLPGNGSFAVPVPTAQKATGSLRATPSSTVTSAENEKPPQRLHVVSLLARVTFPFLCNGTEPASAPSFVVQIADMDQTGQELLAYLLHHGRVRFSNPSQLTHRPTDYALYCAGPGDVDTSPSTDSDSGALLHVEGAPLRDYSIIRAAQVACASGAITTALRRSLLATRALHIARDSATAGTSSESTTFLASAETLTGSLFDLELFVFERDFIPDDDMTPSALKRGLCDDARGLHSGMP